MRKAYETLFQALEQRDVDALKKAIGRKAIHDWTDQDGEGPLHWACGEGTVEQLAMVLDVPGASLEARGRRRRYTPMRIAVAFGDAEKVRLLLDRGASLHQPHGSMELDTTYLDHCTSAATATLLIERGLPVDRTSQNGTTPIYWAAAGGHLDVLNVLLEHGADPFRRMSGGATLLHGAARSHGPNAPAMVARLLDLGVDPMLSNDSGNTVAEEARLHKNEAALAVLERWQEAQALRAVVAQEASLSPALRRRF